MIELAKQLTLQLSTSIRAVAWRQNPSGVGDEVLLFTFDGVVPLSQELALGAPLQLKCVRPSLFCDQQLGISPWMDVVCCVSTGTEVYFATERAIWRLGLQNNVRMVAGREPRAAEEEAAVAAAAVEDREAVGAQQAPDAAQVHVTGPKARFHQIRSMALGCSSQVLHVLDGAAGDRERAAVLRNVQLPPRGSDAWSPAVATQTLTLNTLGPDVEEYPCHLAYDHRRGPGGLLVASRKVVYSLSRSLTRPLVLVGAPDEEDARAMGGSAHLATRFNEISSIVVNDATGELLVLDLNEGYAWSKFHLHTVAPNGTKHCIADASECRRMVLLPSGGVALYGGAHLQLLQRPDIKAWRAPGTAPLRPLDGRKRLAADLAGLHGGGSGSGGGADAGGGGAAGGASVSAGRIPTDITVMVGRRPFPAHRVVLAASCPYFERLFAGGFKDSDQLAVALPDADPAAFEHLLGYIYGGTLEPTPELLRGMAELADRLLLSEASAHLQQEMVAAKRPATVAADMLWAHRRGMGEVLQALTSYYLEVADLVAEEAPDSLEQLLQEAPKLYLQLHMALVQRGSQR